MLSLLHPHAICPTWGPLASPGSDAAAFVAFPARGLHVAFGAWQHKIYGCSSRSEAGELTNSMTQGACTSLPSLAFASRWRLAAWCPGRAGMQTGRTLGSLGECRILSSYATVHVCRDRIYETRSDKLFRSSSTRHCQLSSSSPPSGNHSQ